MGIKKAHAEWADNVCNTLEKLIREERQANNGLGFAIINDQHVKGVKHMSDKLANVLGLIIRSFLEGGFNDTDLKRLNHIFKEANSSDTFKIVDGKEVVTHGNPTLNDPEESDEAKYIHIIASLRAMGFSKAEIEAGINALDENKYKTFDVNSVLTDIVKNITTQKEIQSRKLN